MAQTKRDDARARGIGRNIVPLIALAVVLLVATVGIFSYVAYVDHNRLQWRLTASQIERFSPELVSDALRAVTGQEDAAAQLQVKINVFESLLSKLEKGDPETRMPPVKDDLRASLEAVRFNWGQVRPTLESIIAAGPAYARVKAAGEVIVREVPEIIALSDEVVQQMVRAGVGPGQTYLAQRQQFLILRMKTAASELLRGEENASVALEKFGRDAALFERVLEAMLSGRGDPEVQRVEEPSAREKLRQVAVKYGAMRESVDAVMQSGPTILEASKAFQASDELSTGLIAAAGDLQRKATSEHDALFMVNIAGYVTAAATLIAVILLGVVLVRDARRREEISREQNDRNQQAILRLLDEMMNLAEGDLTRHATVTEDITGAIADSVNYTIDALRDLVATIQRTAEQVGSSAGVSQATSMRLSEASQEQALRIEQASEAVNIIAGKVSEVAEGAVDSVSVAQSSMEVAHKGGEAVRQTIHGMERIREQIQDTSKRLKRLGESSQEIGDIVGLITDIADQTNILALNAAIQAAMAGEAGRGFAVVADEVQRLAERVGNATKQIETLVKTIQSDTQEAMLSMEQTTTNVVGGAQVAENAGRSLEEIETVSATLAQRIQAIAQAAREQLEEAARIRETMHLISEQTSSTAQDAQEAAQEIGKLNELASELRTSVAGFKLPESA
ncbi:methyl-accepting chemotaxis protein [Thiofaba sp. EF100]|uniref:methyl-accepting chemotaxis protein n=1 Tax=Thiofaba sp. EF100 TaxID=3121274 RepID=UPI003221D190